MKLIELTPSQITREFGARFMQLPKGGSGLLHGLKCEVKSVATSESVVNSEECMDFIGSDGSVDRYNEVIDPNGWQLENFRANPVIPDCHDYSSVAKILGRAESVEVKDGKLVNRVRFATQTPMGNIAWKLSRGGFIKSQSVGFIPVEWTNGHGKDLPDRTYSKAELLEISLVVVPANPGATIGLALKSGAIVKSDVTAVIAVLKQFCSEEKPDHTGPGSASADVVLDAHSILRMARGFEEVMKRA